MELGIAFSYLKAIDDTGLGVRIMPVGLALFDRLPWSEMPHVFTASISEPFINVVCVPQGVTLGAPADAKQFALPDGDQDLAIAGDGPGEGNYKPETAIIGLYTDNVFNVAIVDWEGEVDQAELYTLCRYSRVICPTHEATTALCKQGVPAATIPPESDKLAKLFADFLV